MNIRFTEADLDNGLHVILHEDHHLPIVAVNLWYHVGSKNEQEGKTGFAHLFEHLMFQGSANVPSNAHFKYVQEAGGTLNASTSFDRTNYFETLPAHQYELGLWLEADRMRSLNISSQNLETQRSVVIEERRSRYDNQPYGTMFEQLFRHAFKLQPYKWPTIGSIEDISAASLDDVVQFHRMFYTPANASLCLAGDFDSGNALDLIQTHFGGIVSLERNPYRPFIREPQQTMQVRNYFFDSVPLPAIVIGFRIPEQSAASFMQFEGAANILSSGRSSRFYNKLVYDLGIAQSVAAFAYGLELPGLFIIRAVARPGVDAGDLERAIWDAIDALIASGPADEEIQKARNSLNASFINNAFGIQSRADLLNMYHVQFGRADKINEEEAQIQQISAQQVQQVAAEYFTARNSTVLHYLPYPKS